MNKIKYSDYFNKNEIIKLYNSGMSGIQIAEKLHTKPQFIYRFMKYHNIKRRSLQASMKNAYKTKRKLGNKTRVDTTKVPVKKEDILYYYYVLNLTKKETAKKLGVALSRLDTLMMFNDIKIKPRTEINNPNWQGGVMFDGKRKLIYYKDHPNPDFLKNYIYEYRLIIERHLGRFLKPDEVVHHINGDVTDNRIKNLQLCKNQSEHCKIHNFGRKK